MLRQFINALRGSTPGQRLRWWMDYRGYTVKALSIDAKVSPNTLSNLRNDWVDDPHWDTMDRICRALNCKVSDIWPQMKKYESTVDYHKKEVF